VEISDIVLAFVSILSAITGGVVKSVMKDIKDLEHNMNHCQTSLPKEFVMKDDYRDDIKEIKTMLGKLFDKVEGKQK